MEIRAQENGSSLKVRLEGSSPKAIQTDIKRFKQILINLVGNAVKFTERGQVEVVAHFDTQSNQLKVIVEDTGIGISGENLRELFHPFSKRTPVSAENSEEQDLDWRLVSDLPKCWEAVSMHEVLKGKEVPLL